MTAVREFFGLIRDTLRSFGGLYWGAYRRDRDLARQQRSGD